MKYRVLITCPQLQQTIDEYRPFFAERKIEIEVPPVAQQLTEGHVPSSGVRVRHPVDVV